MGNGTTGVDRTSNSVALVGPDGLPSPVAPAGVELKQYVRNPPAAGGGAGALGGGFSLCSVLNGNVFPSEYHRWGNEQRGVWVVYESHSSSSIQLLCT
ncbi:hypothetical protein DPEC_G00083590 [Dallia pectoralis]|uniref:Uncharacterized protein n=1 Tax=Dallia pectoralis TaxID=75939 RepID=A0ACC2GZ22_DALPE|nr:hypothetical protein DPEC_G00083590 [Dallia pectoralis]